MVVYREISGWLYSRHEGDSYGKGNSEARALGPHLWIRVSRVPLVQSHPRSPSAEAPTRAEAVEKRGMCLRSSVQKLGGGLERKLQSKMRKGEEAPLPWISSLPLPWIAALSLCPGLSVPLCPIWICFQYEQPL